MVPNMFNNTSWVVVSALVGSAACGKGDDCQKFWDKTAPMMSKMGGDKKMFADAKDRFLKECRDGAKMRNDPTFKCVLGAGDEAAISACMGKAFGDYASKSKMIEAKLQLTKLGKNLKVYFQTESTFPAGKAGPMPAAACCKGEGGKCAAVPADTWAADPIWNKLDFIIDEPTRFQYSYESDGKTATATAVGDLDCDGTMITYKLDMTVDASGGPTMALTEPAPGAD